jgi:Na+/H+ antiporter NhaD/arsenite permease-like protein
MMLQLISPSSVVAQLLAALIFVLTYFYIATGRRSNAIAALAGVGAIWAFGIMTSEEMLNALDINTLGLLFGMMIVAGGLTEAGFFRLVGVYLANLVECRPFRMFIALTVTTAFLSAFLDNVTTVLFMIAVTIEIMKILELDPVPYILGEILAANVGGTSTLIGDPPNIMIAEAAEFSFLDFLLNTGPVAVFGIALMIVYFYLRSGETLKVDVSMREIPLEPEEVIGDRRLFAIGTVVFLSMVALFFLHESLGITPSTIALGSAIAMLFLGGPRMPAVLENVDWETLLFVGSLFIVVGALVKTGLIREMSILFIEIVGVSQLWMISSILWFSSFSSALVDNIPFTAAFIPLLEYVEEFVGTNTQALWWALSIGAGFGGNGTIIASSATIAGLGASTKHGYKVTFKEFLRVGMPVMLLTTLLGNAMLLAFTIFGLYN